MDQFYLNNVGLYQGLVKSFDATTPAPHFSRFAPGARQKEMIAEQYSPDMVVSARIRPMLHDDLTAGFPCAAYPRTRKTGGTQVVDLHDLYNHPRGRPLLKSTKHQVDRLYDSNATTEEIYEDMVVDLISIARNGGIGTLFAYGQTGSGKTFTISQLQRLAAFELMDENGDDSTELFMTIFDLAKNSASDLLNDRKPIAILEDAYGTTQLAGATEHRVSDKEELLKLLDHAASLRSTASTSKNDASSRSHSICRLRISNPASSKADGILYLVDLAGSEAARDRAAHGAERMRETREINMSLSVLKDCMRGKVEADTLRLAGQMSRQKKIHVPIRGSTLTKVLKHVFDPDDSRTNRTVVIACVNPSLADVAPSKNTLRYAEMLRITAPVAVR